jgi:hypothetical protein
MFHLIENAKMINIQVPKDMSSAAHTTEYISAKNARMAWFVINCGVLTSTGNQAVTLYVADNASGTHNKAITSASANCTLTFDHMYKRASGADTFTKTTVASSTFNITKSSDNCTFVIPVDLHRMGTFIDTSVTYQADYLRLNVASPGAHACLQNSFCILTGLRYQEDVPPTAIT